MKPIDLVAGICFTAIGATLLVYRNKFARYSRDCGTAWFREERLPRLGYYILCTLVGGLVFALIGLALATGFIHTTP